MADGFDFLNYKEQIKYPQDCTTILDKVEFLFSAQETLKLKHNQKGKDYREGRLDKIDWQQWLLTYFEPRSAKISSDLCVVKENLKKSKRFSIDLDTLEL